MTTPRPMAAALAGLLLALAAIPLSAPDELRPDDARSAVAALTRAYAGRPYEEQHDAAHVLARDLAAHGVDASDLMAACGVDQTFGCYHGASAVLAAGDVRTVCHGLAADAARPCWHGVGHVVMERSGGVLTAALRACGDGATGPAERSSCENAVFMDALARALQDGDRQRYIPGLGPCPDLDDTHRDECYRARPLAWMVEHRGDARNAVRACEQVPDTYRHACAEAGGAHLAQDRAGAEARGICAALGAPGMRVACLTGYAGRGDVLAPPDIAAACGDIARIEAAADSAPCRR